MMMTRVLILAGFLILLPSCRDSSSLNAEEQVPEVKGTAGPPQEGTLEFTETLQRVVKHLGKGGVHYSLTDVEGDAEEFGRIIDQVIGPMSSGPDAVLPPSFSFGGLLRDLNVDHVKAIGQSAHQEGDYWHSRAFLLTEGRRGGLLSLLGGKGKSFQAPTFVPADADLVIELELNLKQARDVAKKIATSFGPEAEQGLGEAFGEKLLEGSLSLGDFLGKFKVRLVVAAVFDQNQKIPLSEELTIPGVKLVARLDGAKWMWEAYHKFLAEDSDTKKADGLELLLTPEPMETPMGEVQPVLALDEETGSIWFSLHEEYLQEVRAGENTLASSSDFQKALKGLPEHGNALVYNSSQMVAELNKVYRLAQEDLAAQGGEQAAAMEVAKAFMLPFADIKPLPFAGVIANNEEGVLIAMNGPTPIKRRSVMGSTTTIAALAALATPQIYKALERARLAENISRARQVKLALETYASDFDGDYPPNLEAMVKSKTVDEGWEHRNMLCSDKQERPWGYVPGLTNLSPGDRILLYGAEESAGKRIVVFLDGSVLVKEEAEFQELLKLQKGEEE